MDNRGQVSHPLFWRLWLIGYIGMGVSLLASIVFPGFGIRAAYGELYPVAWGVFLLPITLGLIGHYTAKYARKNTPDDPQKRLSDYEEGPNDEA